MDEVVHESHPGLDYGAAIDCSPVASLIVAIAIAVAWLALVAHAIVSWARARDAEKVGLALDAAAPSMRLTEGVGEIIGEVVADGDQPVATLTITQSGFNESRKRQKWHEWRETARHTTLRPFSIRTSGGLVKVAIDNAHVLTTSLETRSIGPRVRDRLARIRPGERVVAHGELVAAAGLDGYRGETGWELKPAGGRPTLSTASQTEPAVRAKRYFRRAIPFLAGWALVLQLVIFGPFWLLALAGHIEPVVIDRVVAERHPAHRRSTAVTWAIGVARSGPVEAVTSPYVRRGDVVPVLVAPSHLTYSIGSEPRIDLPRCYFGVVLVLFSWAIYLARATALRPWWRTRRLVETGADWLPAS